MSERSYINGFCKTAAASNVDPRRLARYALTKSADSGTIWNNVKAYLDQAQEWYNRQSATTKALIGAGGGALIGGALGGLIGGRKGLAAGGVVGGLGGAAAVSDLKKLLSGKRNKDISDEQVQGIREAAGAAVTPQNIVKRTAALKQLTGEPSDEFDYDAWVNPGDGENAHYSNRYM